MTQQQSSVPFSKSIKKVTAKSKKVVKDVKKAYDGSMENNGKPLSKSK